MKLPPDLGRRLVIVVALVAAGFLAAWLRFRPYLENEATYTDGSDSYELSEVDRLRFAIWDDPAPLPPWINTEDHEGAATLSPDGRQLVFVVGEAGLNAELFVAEMIDGAPVDPRPLARLNTSADELAPAFSSNALWFASNRGGGQGGFDLWSAEWDDGRFGPAEWVAGGLNTKADETDPAPLPGSNAVAFASNRPRGAREDFDLYFAVPGFAGDDTRVDPIVELNSAFEEREPAFTPEGGGLLFASDRSGGIGGYDLWRSVQRHGDWLEPVLMEGLNTPLDERAPKAVRDNFSLLFARQNPAGDLDLQRATSLELTRVPGRPVGWWELSLLALLMLLALLTWLGKRWEALDILAKCLLVSLLVHGGLLWWFRDVAVGGSGAELPEAPPTFTVKLSTQRNTPSASREREGRVEAERSTLEVSEPVRQRSSRESFLAEQQISAPRAELLAPSMLNASSPGRAVAFESRQPTPTPSTLSAPEVELQTAPEIEARSFQADAPALEVAEASVSASRKSTSSASAPTRATRRASASLSTAVASEVTPKSLTDLSAPSLSNPSAPKRQRVAQSSVAAASSSQSLERSQAVELDHAPSAIQTSAAGQSAVAQASQPSPSLDLAPSTSAAASPSSLRASAAPQRRGSVASAEPRQASSALAAKDAPSTMSGLEVALVSQNASPRVSASRPTRRGSRSARAAHAPVELQASTQITARANSTPQVAQAESAVMSLPDPVALPLLDSGRSTPSAPARRPTRTNQLLAMAMPLPEIGPARTPLPKPEQQPYTVALPTTERTPWEQTPYKSRVGDAKTKALAEYGGSQATEAAVAAGLAYLAEQQSPMGLWGGEEDYHEKYGHVAVGKTALCLLAFLGAGHVPDGSTQYAENAERAVDFLLAQQDERTGHFGYSSSYSHAVTTYALAECFALTRMPRLRKPLERAVEQILQHQNKEPDPRRFGGWGYYYPDRRIFDPWPRTSISTWQIMALESSRLGGLEVPDKAFVDARRFLRASHRRDSGVILYSHDPARLSSRYQTLPGSTPAGLFALSILGEDLRSSDYRNAVDYVRERAPDSYRRASDDAFVLRASGNLYFWYYGSLMMLRRGGRAWRAWNESLQSTLLPAQQSDGSWEPISLYAEHAGDDEQDRAYTTAMCVLTLEVYYRYFTPLLQVK